MPNQKKASTDFLLDTHIWIWLNNGAPELSTRTIKTIEDAAQNGKLFISPVSIWELGTLTRKGRISLQSPLGLWVKEAIERPGVRITELSPEVMVESNELPGDFHGDPADRMLIATARVYRATLVTRDKAILDYAKKGFIRAVKG